MAYVAITGSRASLGYDTSASARTLQYAGTLTSGSLLVVSASCYPNTTTVTVSDGTNGAYTQAGTYAGAGDQRASRRCGISKIIRPQGNQPSR